MRPSPLALQPVQSQAPTAVHHLPVPFLTPSAQLAWEEAALDSVEAAESPGLLWFWQASRPFVVVGYGKQIEAEVDQHACEREAVPVLRRCSGGGTVVQGPGCLNYGLALPIEPHGPTATITSTNTWVMNRQCAALQTLIADEVCRQGETDLTLGGLKFSGNAQRRKRQALLFHGTFLLAMDLQLIARCLRQPSLQPGYRANRPHLAFLRNLELPPHLLRDALLREWAAQPGDPSRIEVRTTDLLAHKYGTPTWHAGRQMRLPGFLSRREGAEPRRQK